MIISRRKIRLSGSYFDENIKQDSHEVTSDIERVLVAIQNSNKKIKMTVGGGVTSKTVKPLLENDFLISNIHAIETRKCMIDSKKILEIQVLLMTF